MNIDSINKQNTNNNNCNITNQPNIQENNTTNKSNNSNNNRIYNNNIKDTNINTTRLIRNNDNFRYNNNSMLRASSPNNLKFDNCHPIFHAHLCLGLIGYFYLNDYDASLQHFKQAHAREPYQLLNFVFLYHANCIVRNNTMKLKKHIDSFSKTEKAKILQEARWLFADAAPNPDICIIFYRIYRLQKDIKKAKEQLEIALKLNSE
eukprot:UN28785